MLFTVQLTRIVNSAGNLANRYHVQISHLCLFVIQICVVKTDPFPEKGD